MRDRGLSYVIPCRASVLEANSFRVLSQAEQLLDALRERSQLPALNPGEFAPRRNPNLLRCRRSLYLVLETSTLSSTFGGHRLPSAEAWSKSADGPCCSTDALPGPRLGGSRRQSRE